MITDLVLLSCVGIRCVLVHGGGPEINSWLAKVGIEAVFKNGLRVTDGERRAASKMACWYKASNGSYSGSSEPKATVGSRGGGCGTTPRPEGVPCKKPTQKRGRCSGSSSRG